MFSSSYIIHFYFQVDKSVTAGLTVISKALSLSRKFVDIKKQSHYKHVAQKWFPKKNITGGAF
ncbi:MAG: hypothetical protein ACLPP9_00570 [Smithella sp.]